MEKTNVVTTPKAKARPAPPESLARTDEGAFVSHAALLRLAMRQRCSGIHSEPVLTLCRPQKNFWVFKATVYKSAKCRGFVGYGDAHPGNVSPLIFNNASDAAARPGHRGRRSRGGRNGCG
jgi:hypothetical protein